MRFLKSFLSNCWFPLEAIYFCVNAQEQGICGNRAVGIQFIDMNLAGGWSYMDDSEGLVRKWKGKGFGRFSCVRGDDRNLGC